MTRTACLLASILLLGSCDGGAPEARTTAFKPVSAGVFLNYFGGRMTVRISELDPKAIGYDHVPRSAFLVIPLGNESRTRFSLVDASEKEVGGASATMRVIEHGTLPRLFVIEGGTLEVTPGEASGGLGTFVIRLDARLVDTTDGGSRLHLEGTFEAPVEGLT